MKIAFVGVGRMGSRMASRLIEAGHELSVYDPFAPAVEALKQQGAAAAGNPAEAAEGAEIIMLSLPSPATFTDAVTGETGILNKVSRVQSLSISAPWIRPPQRYRGTVCPQKRLLPRFTGQRRSCGGGLR